MKKLLIILVGVLLLPLTVYADMGAPENMTYEVEITNPDGISLYKINCGTNNTNCKLVKNATIPKGAAFSIYYEEKINGEDYAYISYKKNSGYIKISDVTITSKEISLDDESVNKLKNPYKRTVLVDELKVYSSPAKGFKVVGTIPKGVEIELTHSSGDSWYYVEYKNIKGWVDYYNGTLGEYHDVEFEILTERKIYSEISFAFSDDDANIVGTIPANTKIKGYYSLDQWSRYKYYVEYDGIKGYIDSNDIASIQENKKVKLFNKAKGFKTFSKADECVYTDCKADIVIPEGTELNFLKYSSNSGNGPIPSFYQVEYKNEKYWIFDGFWIENSSFLEYSYVARMLNENKIINEELSLYNNPNDAADADDEDVIAEPIGTIAKDEEVKAIYSIDGYMYYFEKSDGTKGWAKYYNYVTYEEETTEETTDKKDDEEIEIKEKGLSEKEFLYICIGGAVALTLTVVVIIIIINKKRKAQNQQNI